MNTLFVLFIIAVFLLITKVAYGLSEEEKALVWAHRHKDLLEDDDEEEEDDDEEEDEDDDDDDSDERIRRLVQEIEESDYWKKYQALSPEERARHIAESEKRVEEAIRDRGHKTNGSGS